MKRDGDSAFPTVARDGNWQPHHDGMSLRDYIATTSLPVIWSMTQFAVEADLAGHGKLTLTKDRIDEDALAKGAYALADAMLREREK